MIENERSTGIPYLLALSCSLGGLQVIWSVVLSNGTQYLMSLGFSRPLTALVWLAGPLCGIFVQPIIGALSDSHRGTWGRRRPFLLLGTIGVVVSILTLAFVEELINTILTYSDTQDQLLSRPLIQTLAVVAVYCMNLSIQPIQVSARALVVECCPSHQQTQASAWTTYSIGIANTAGYIFGLIKLPELPYLSGLSQFQCLSLVAMLSLVIAVSITCAFADERNHRLDHIRALEKGNHRALWSHLLWTSRKLPKLIEGVFQIQFCAWMGWFPLLYYTTEYMAELYTDTHSPRRRMVKSVPPTETLFESGHSGKLAFLLFACVSLLTSIFISFFQHYEFSPAGRSRTPLGGSLKMSDSATSGIVPIWMGAHVLFAALMFATTLVASPIGGLALIACAGIPWAITLWAPFAIIGTEISGDDSYNHDDRVGAILSLHNIAISTPQIFAALLSYILLTFVDSIAWVLTAGGCAALAAAYLTYHLQSRS